MSNVSDRAIDTATDLSKSLVSYTKKNPITALLLVLGAGGFWSARRNPSARKDN